MIAAVPETYDVDDEVAYAPACGLAELRERSIPVALRQGATTPTEDRPAAVNMNVHEVARNLPVLNPGDQDPWGSRQKCCPLYEIHSQEISTWTPGGRRGTGYGAHRRNVASASQQHYTRTSPLACLRVGEHPPSGRTHIVSAAFEWTMPIMIDRPCSASNRCFTNRWAQWARRPSSYQVVDSSATQALHPSVVRPA